MREKTLKRLAQFQSVHPWWMILIILLFTGFFTILSSRLTITMRWADLLPSKDVRTLQFNRILEEFNTATSIVVVVQGEEKEIKAFAEEIVPLIQGAVDTSNNAILEKEIERKRRKLSELRSKRFDNKKIDGLESEIAALQSSINKKIVQRIDYKTELDFLKEHGLLLIKEDDLKNIEDLFFDADLPEFLTDLNNTMEKEYVGRSESISTREKEDQAVVFLDGILAYIHLLGSYGRGENISDSEARWVVDKLLYGEPFYLSYDKQALILNIIPNFSFLDMDLVISGTQIIKEIIDRELTDFPGVTAGLTGMIPLAHDEMIYAEKSLGSTSVIAFIAILVLLILSFRMWIAPILAGINLLVGVIWATGVAFLVVGQLNIMTSMFSVILLGLGIDFSIHIISGFTENRAAGHTIARALENTMDQTGKGILTGAMTTSVAFFTLTVSSSRGMKEMGLVCGFGLMSILLVTLLFLPALLVLRERRLDRKYQKSGKPSIHSDISFAFLGKSAFWLGRNYPLSLIGAAIITAALILSAFKISFDHNYMNIEPEGLTSIVLQDTIMNKFDMAMDYGLVIASGVEQSRQRAKAFREAGSVAMVEDISTYLPSVREQDARMPYLRAIADSMRNSSIRARFNASDRDKILEELKRLEMNILEMQDMAFLGGQDKVDNKCDEFISHPNPDSSSTLISALIAELGSESGSFVQLQRYQKQAAPYFKESVLRMCDASPLSLSDLPVSILDRYSNSSRDQFLVTIFPAGNIWQDSEFLSRFVDELERVDVNTTGMPPVFRALIEIIGRDGRLAALLTLGIMFILLCFDFRHPGYALAALIPLTAGVFWMVGLMQLLGLQLTVVNVMGIPLIIGIGIDDGVHIIHRWIREGKKNIRQVFASTGKAILLTSLTTMLGFGSLIFSIWRGFGQLGAALFIGVAACFLTTVLFLSGILGFLSRKERGLSRDGG